MNSQADSQKFKKNGTEFRTGETGLEKPYLDKVFVRSETGLFFVWAQPDWLNTTLRVRRIRRIDYCSGNFARASYCKIKTH